MDGGSLLWTVPASWRSGPTDLFDLGIVVSGEFYRWERVADLRYDAEMLIRHDRGDAGVTTRITRELTFGIDGIKPIHVRLEEEPVTTDARDFFSRGLTSVTTRVETVVEQVRERVADAQFPVVRDRLARGDEVGFGALRATEEEIRHEDNALSWRELSWFGFLHKFTPNALRDDGAFVGIGWDHDRGYFELPAAEVANIQTLERLFDSIPRSPKRLPVTGDYELPGLAESRGTLFFRCTGCGVVGNEKTMEYRTTDRGDYEWPIAYVCHCGHAGQVNRADVVARDAEWVCERCNVILAIPADAVKLTCPMCHGYYSR